jgi:hypothetical protein
MGSDNAGFLYSRENVRAMKNGHLANAIRGYEERYPHHKGDERYKLLLEERDRRDRDGWDDGKLPEVKKPCHIACVDITVRAENADEVRKIIYNALLALRAAGTFEEVEVLAVDSH